MLDAGNAKLADDPLSRPGYACLLFGGQFQIVVLPGKVNLLAGLRRASGETQNGPRGSGLKRFIAVRCLNAVLIDRGGSHDRDPLAPLADLLERGDSLIIFPEGTRGTGPVGPFKSGLFHLARRFPNAELVPINIENLHRILPKGTWLLVPLICTLRIGAPIHVAVDEPKEVFLTRARADLIALGRPI